MYIYDTIILVECMFKKIRNIKINYKQYGSGSDVVLLHGWGQNIQMMLPLGDKLSASHRITIIDLPGFGVSDKPEFAYTIFDYTEIVHDLLASLKINDPILIGHSFGGRIAIIYASRYKVNKLVLFGSPCVRHEYKSLKQSFYKTIKKISILSPLVNWMKNHTGSTDYKNATPLMREILVKTAIEEKIDVIPIPGACALINGLIASGLDTKEFIFYGFLPLNKKLRKEKLEEILYQTKTCIIYEAPHKIKNTLNDLEEILDNRKVVLARE